MKFDQNSDCAKRQAVPLFQLQHPTLTARSEGYGLYVHIPYCLSKCPYCDFNSYAVDSSFPDEEHYSSALATELRSYRSLSSFKDRAIRTIFFGGGTPSLLAPESLQSLFELIRNSSHSSQSQTKEITLEANPGTIREELGLEKLRGFRSLGFNRISFGIQSFNSDKLSFLGRIHTPEDSFQAMSKALLAGFENINLDLIFGLKNESLESWTTDLKQAIELSPQHISVYNLTIEPGTEFGRQNKLGTTHTASDKASAKMFLHTRDLLEAAGYEQYEVSNYARPGYRCQHNLGYWEGRDYLGLGAGAHSFLRLTTSDAGKTQARIPKPNATSLLRWWNLPGPKQYKNSIEAIGYAANSSEVLNLEEHLLECLFLRLRTNDGVCFENFYEIFGARFEEKYAAKIRKLVDEGWAEINNQTFALTPEGLLLLDEILVDLG